MSNTNWRKVVEDANPSSLGGGPAIFGNAQFFINGHATFKSIVEAIRAANQPGNSIYILGWMLEIDFELIPCDKNSTLLALLTSAVSNGVYVYVLIWDNPQYPATKYVIWRLRNELDKSQRRYNYIQNRAHNNLFDINIDNQSPIPRLNSVPLLNISSLYSAIEKFLLAGVYLAPIPFQIKCKELLDMLKGINSVGSHHEKIVIIKTQQKLIGFCGGIDINPNRLNTINGIFDLQCRIEGNVVNNLLQHIWKRNQNLNPNRLVIPNFNTYNTTATNNANIKIVNTYNLRRYPNQIVYDRSMYKTLKEIIKNAKTYIYIEDQYIISIEVAKLLNQKIREPNFKKLIILTQDPRVTQELLFPIEKRHEFYKTLMHPPVDSKKVGFYMTDLDKSASGNPQIYVHSKVYVIDDELVLIGSANCSSRSLTLDSETGVVIFDSDAAKQIVKQFRMNLWWDRTKELSGMNPDPILASQCFEDAVLSKYSKITHIGARGKDLDHQLLSPPPASVIATLISPVYAAAKQLTSMSLGAIVRMAKDPLWKYFIEPDNGY